MAFADSQANGVILYGEGEAQIVLAGTVKLGDALGYSGGWVRALATASAVIQMRCVAGEDGVSGQTIVAYFGKTLLGGSRFSGATDRGALYVAEAALSGQYTQTAPSTATDATTIVGVAVGATQGLLTPNFNVDSVA